MDRECYACECFSSGFNCAQSVFTAFSREHGIDNKTALRISGSFGAGMGYLSEACGAVTGAFMVLGLIYGQDEDDDKYSKARNYLLVKDFAHRFKKINGSINCTELLNVDLSDEKQLIAARTTDIFETKCPKYVSDAVKILEDIINENKR